MPGMKADIDAGEEAGSLHLDPMATRKRLSSRDLQLFSTCRNSKAQPHSNALPPTRPHDSIMPLT